MDLAQFSNMVVERLSVHGSYSEADVPNAVLRFITKLLRDYNFPKSMVRKTYTGLSIGQRSYALPADTKRVLAVMFRDDSDAAHPAYSLPLLKREGMVTPESDGVPRYYWIEGTTLWTDITLTAGDVSSTSLELVYQSNNPQTNLTWVLNDFQDALFSLVMYRLSGELGKPELMQLWAPMWQEDQRGLAIYLNELEYGGMEMLMRPAAPARTERYPIS